MPRLTPRLPGAQPSIFRPKLYNASRIIESCRGLRPADIKRLEKDPYWQGWRSLVSQDVVEFVDRVEGRDITGHPVNEMLPEEKLKLLRSPANYFSRPYNVPENLRHQIYFPDFTITLLRTPHLGPFFAQFQVPLSMGKLDMKSYLKNVYNVDVHHVRSFVVHRTPDRERPTNKYQKGKLVARSFKKKMTVQLVEPFAWPAELTKDQLEEGEYEKKKYWDSTKKIFDMNRQQQEDFVTRPDMKHRRSIAEQAKALLEGRETWQPTWKQLIPSVRAMEGRQGRPSPHSDSPPSALR